MGSTGKSKKKTTMWSGVSRRIGELSEKTEKGMKESGGSREEDVGDVFLLVHILCRRFF